MTSFHKFRIHQSTIFFREKIIAFFNSSCKVSILVKMNTYRYLYFLIEEFYLVLKENKKNFVNSRKDVTNRLLVKQTLISTMLPHVHQDGLDQPLKARMYLYFPWCFELFQTSLTLYLLLFFIRQNTCRWQKYYHRTENTSTYI